MLTWDCFPGARGGFFQFPYKGHTRGRQLCIWCAATCTREPRVCFSQEAAPAWVRSALAALSRAHTGSPLGSLSLPACRPAHLQPCSLLVRRGQPCRRVTLSDHPLTPDPCPPSPSRSCLNSGCVPGTASRTQTSVNVCRTRKRLIASTPHETPLSHK